jgi:hypothetical protein
MLDEIYLKCDICEEAHYYQLTDNFIVAIDSEWKSNTEGEYLSPTLEFTSESLYAYQVLMGFLEHIN